jgi:N-acetylneuraminate synthase
MPGPPTQDRQLFENFFVLEYPNNHWGRVASGLKSIRDFRTVVHFNSIKTPIKLQFRHVDCSIHPYCVGSADNRYISKTEATMTKDEFAILVAEVVSVGCIPMATPSDEASVDLCVEFDFPMIEVASSDVNDWPLLEMFALTRRLVIACSGGASGKNLGDIVVVFGMREIPLAINQCVSLYPSDDLDLELNQIGFLRDQYPDQAIGFSSLEQYDWQASMIMSCAKGARTWERHIDADGIRVSPYCATLEQADTGFKAVQKTKAVSSGSSTDRRVLLRREIEYVNDMVRGAYAQPSTGPGCVFGMHSFEDDPYMAIPLCMSQLSVRDIVKGEPLTISSEVDQPLTIDQIGGHYAVNPALSDMLLN